MSIFNRYKQRARDAGLSDAEAEDMFVASAVTVQAQHAVREARKHFPEMEDFELACLFSKARAFNGGPLPPGVGPSDLAAYRKAINDAIGPGIDAAVREALRNKS